MIQLKEIQLPTFTLPRIVNGTKVYPGVKDLPAHIHQNFRNEFIRFVIKHIANSELPWVNPDVDSFQTMFNIVYPTFRARIRHNDAIYHPVSDSPTMILYNADTYYKTVTTLGVLRNHLASAAIPAVQRYIVGVFCKKRLDTVETRAQYIAKLFKSEDDHQILWREYVEGDIPNHPEVGGYKTVCFLLRFTPSPSEYLT